MQAGLLLLLLCALASTPAHADDGGTSTVNILPAGGKHRGIVLRSQTVDVVLREEQGTVWGDTRVWLNLYNPASKPITVTVTLPGPQLYPLPLPGNLSARVGKAPLPLAPVGGSGEPQQAQGEIGLPARSAVEVYLDYRQALPERDGRAIYAYMLSGAEQWAGTIQSLRVTIDLRPPLSADRLLTVAPRAHRENSQTLNWHWETEWAKTRPNVGLVLIAPDWWRDLSAAREAAATSPSADAHLALAQHYVRLAFTAPLAFEGQDAYHDRYYPAAVAELQAAIAASTTLTDTYSAHVLLADLYRQEAARSETDKAERYLQSASAELQAALAIGLPDPRAAAIAEQVYSGLLDFAERRGDQSAANTYRRQAAAATGAAGADGLGHDGLALRLQQALTAAARGDYRPGRAVLTDVLGPAQAPSGRGTAPLAREMTLYVETRADQRVITLNLVGGENLSAIQDLVGQTVSALSPFVPAAVTADSQQIVLTLPLQPGDAGAAGAVAASLPEAPELALLRAALAGQPRLTRTETRFGRSAWHYEENVDLTPAVQEWEQIADSLASAVVAPAGEMPPEITVLVDQLQREVRRADARAWRELAQNSRAEYRLALENPQVDQVWQVSPTASRLLQFEADRWDFSRLRWAVVAACGLLAAVAAGIWRAM